MCRADWPSAPTRSRALITAENGKPMKWARGEVGRAVSVFRWAAEETRRFSGELQRLDTDAAAAGRMAIDPPLPARARARHRAVQLPAEPGRAQGRAGDRGRRADRAQARTGHAAVGAAARRAAGRDRPAAACSRCCRCPTTRWPQPRPGPATAGRVVHRLRDRSGSRCSTRRRASTSRWSSAATPRPWCCADYSRDADLDWAASRIATFSNYQAGQSCISVQRVLRRPLGVRPRSSRRSSRRSRRRRPATRGDDSTDVGPLIDERSGRARRGVGRRGSVARAPRCSPAAPATAPPTRRPSSSTCPPTRRSLTEEVFGPVLMVDAFDGARRGVRARSTTRASACRPASSPTTCRPPSGRTATCEVGGVDRRRRAELPRRPDALRRREGVRRRPRGPEVRDGGLHLRARDGADRPGALIARAPDGDNGGVSLTPSAPDAPSAIVLLGSTGSIGTQAIDVVRAQPGPFPGRRSGCWRVAPRPAGRAGARARRRGRRGSRGTAAEELTAGLLRRGPSPRLEPRRRSHPTDARRRRRRRRGRRMGRATSCSTG